MGQIIVRPYVGETNASAFFDPLVLPVDMVGYRKKALPLKVSDREGVSTIGLNLMHQSIVGDALADICLKTVDEVSLLGFRLTKILYPVVDGGEVGVETVIVTDPAWVSLGKVEQIMLPRPHGRKCDIKSRSCDKYLLLRFMGEQPLAIYLEYLFDI